MGDSNLGLKLGEIWSEIGENLGLKLGEFGCEFETFSGAFLGLFFAFLGVL